MIDTKIVKYREKLETDLALMYFINILEDMKKIKNRECLGRNTCLY